MGFGNGEFSISPTGSLSIIPWVSGESEIHPPSGGMENVLGLIGRMKENLKSALRSWLRNGGWEFDFIS